VKNFEAGKYISQGSYKSFQPSEINRQWIIDDPEIQELLSLADRQLGRLDMFSQYVPNIDLFISMHVVKEATQSSRIEGTQTNIEEALMEEKEVPPEKRNDWQEVQRYIEAMNFALDKSRYLPFSSRLIRETHDVLLKSVRGKHKLPGRYRTSQNWIGGAAIRDAIFVPPNSSSIHDLMSDLEKFVHNENIHIPDLIKVAIVHYQFETIHPFLDGNGRIGRLLITYYLVSRQILKKPVLYISDFLERNRNLYYDNLMRARMKNDIAQWIRFFLSGVIETARSGVDTFDAILQLKNEAEAKVNEKMGGRAHNGQKVLQYLYSRPFIDAKIVSEITGLSPASAYKLIGDFVTIGILDESTGGQRKRRYTFTSYLKLFQV